MRRRLLPAAAILAAAAGFALLFEGLDRVEPEDVSAQVVAGEARGNHEDLDLSFILETGPWGTRARLMLADHTTGEPVPKLAPKVWLTAREGGPMGDMGCRERVGLLLGGDLGFRPAVDFNTFRILLMNEDDTITSLNPQISLSRTRLESILRLPGKPRDWVLHPDDHTLYVAISEPPSLLAVNTNGLKIEAAIELEEAPTSLEFNPLRQRLLVGVQSGRVYGIDVDIRGTMGELESDVVQEGSVQVPPGMDADWSEVSRTGRWAFLVSDAAGEVHVIDRARGEHKGSFSGLPGLGAIHFTNNFAYLSAAGHEEIAMVDLESIAEGSGATLSPLILGQVALPTPAGGGLVAAVSRSGGELFVASPGQRSIFIYGEGRTTAAGSIRNPVSSPQAMKLLDRSLYESAPGVYTTTRKIPILGAYEVSIWLGSERGALCLEIEL